MKICPKCNRQYEYEMTFCLEDGERLIFSRPVAETTAGEEKTLVLPQQEPLTRQRSSAGALTEKPMFGDITAQPKANNNLIVGVICGVLVIFGVLVGSWNYNFFADVNESNSANATPTANPASPIADSGSDMTQFNETFYEGLKAKLGALAAKNELKPLSATILPKDGIELRFHLLADFYGPIYKGVTVEDSSLILKRNNAVWSGRIVRNVIKANSEKDAKERIITQLNQPLSGWDNLWQKLQEYGVLAPPAKSEGQIRTGSALYIVEGRENGRYTYFYFHVPKEKSEIDEERRTAAIFNLLAREFEASDLKAY